MAAGPSIDVSGWLEEQLAQASPDLLRAMVTTFAEALMGAEADAVCGAAYGERSTERTNTRNGYRRRDWDTRAGSISLAIPKLRQGSYFPDWLLERRRRAEAALVTVVATSYLLGVSTRRMEKLVETLGITRLSKSQVSEMAKDLDAQVEAFRTRPLDAGPYTFVAADALVLKVREAGRTVNVHALVATGVNAEGYREILGLHVTSAEDGAGWLGFFRDLTARGLSGVALVTSDAHRGLTEAIGATLPGASWQRCRTHWGRKDSTCRFRCGGTIGLPRGGGEERGGCGIPRCGSGDGASVLFQQGADPCGGAADSAPAYLEQLGYDAPGAHFAQAEDDRQDALRVGDLLGENAAAGSGQPVPAPPLMIPPLGLGGLPEGEPLGQFCQFLPAHPGQRRIAQCRQPVWPGRGVPVARKSRSALAVMNRRTVGTIACLRSASSLPVSVIAFPMGYSLISSIRPVLPCLLVDIPELGIPVRVLPAFQRLGVGLEAEPMLAQEPPHRGRRYPMALPGQFPRQVAQRLGRPA